MPIGVCICCEAR